MRKVNITGRQDSVERASKMVDELISGEPGSAQAIIQKVHSPLSFLYSEIFPWSQFIEPSRWHFFAAHLL